jgi:hypothetical protein
MAVRATEPHQLVLEVDDLIPPHEDVYAGVRMVLTSGVPIPTVAAGASKQSRSTRSMEPAAAPVEHASA